MAVALGRLGVPTSFLGRLSTDHFGVRLRDHLEENSVNPSHVAYGSEPTTLAFVHQEEGREPAFTFYGAGAADRQLRPADLPRIFEDVCALHFGSLSLVWEPTASTLEGLMRREHVDRVVSLDPNVRPGLIGDRHAYLQRMEGWLSSADILKVSRADLAWLRPDEAPETVAREWSYAGPALVIVTLGEDGALGIAPSGTARVPAERVDHVADTVGAGDAFTAGLLGWLKEHERLTRPALEGTTIEDLEAALGFAAEIAALTCRRAGADPPRLNEATRPSSRARESG